MKMVEKLNASLIKARIKMNGFKKDEKGDTNFISILVLLGIGLALAGVFLAFKDDIIEWVDTNIGTFFDESAGRKQP